MIGGGSSDGGWRRRRQVAAVGGGSGSGSWRRRWVTVADDGGGGGGWVVVTTMVGCGVVNERSRGNGMEKNKGGGWNDFEGMECILEWTIPFHRPTKHSFLRSLTMVHSISPSFLHTKRYLNGEKWMELMSRMKMARFQTFWVQTRKNKPLDESHKTGQTLGTKWTH
ncbi:hypothetical protein Hanom_Chr03g00261671 [Helianthus anomalus]